MATPPTRRDLLRLAAAGGGGLLLPRCGDGSVLVPSDAAPGDTRDAAVDTGRRACPVGADLAADMAPEPIRPWEWPSRAPVPGAPIGSACAEQLAFTQTTWTPPGRTDRVPAIHARGYLQVPITEAFRAARDPQTGRDPTSSHGFTVEAWAIDPAFPYSYRTHVVVNAIITLQWTLEWRHGVIAGTPAAPRATATRWVKVAGSGEIAVLEGSLVLRAIDGEPGVTEVLYQYHLQAPLSGHGTIREYLGVIFGRLRDRAHGRALMVDDCIGCPPPPPGY